MTAPAPRAAAPVPDFRRWLPALYPLACILCLVPFVEAVSGLWPAQFDSAAWRFGAAGLFVSFVSSSVLAVLIALCVAHTLRHRAVARMTGLVSVLFALCMLMLCAAFALDTLQVRALVRASAKHGFDLAAGKAMVLALIVIVAFVMLAVAGFKSAAMPAGAHARHRRQRGDGLIVGSEPHGPAEKGLPKRQAGSR
jgi:hypothetical protein